MLWIQSRDSIPRSAMTTSSRYCPSLKIFMNPTSERGGMTSQNIWPGRSSETACGASSIFKVGWLHAITFILLFTAIFIKRYVIHVGGGLIARCWKAYVHASLLTLLGAVSIWATIHGYISWPWSSLEWYVWFAVSAAFTLGPVYQIQAVDRIRSALSAQPQPLPSNKPRVRAQASSS